MSLTILPFFFLNILILVIEHKVLGGRRKIVCSTVVYWNMVGGLGWKKVISMVCDDGCDDAAGQRCRLCSSEVLISFSFLSFLFIFLGMVTEWSWGIGLEALKVKADKIFYTSAGQTFICLETKKLTSVFKCSSACLAQKVRCICDEC